MCEVLRSSIRAAALSLLAAMATGSVMVGTASAEAGPFWHMRAIGAEGAGEKIEPKTPASFTEESVGQTLKGELSKTPVIIKTEGIQVKGAVFNSLSQGQIKVEIIYHQLALVEPVIKGCNVVVGEKNIIQIKGHLMWKWNGESKQLEEQPVTHQTPALVFSGAEPAEGESELDHGNFTVITLSSSCGVLAGTFPVGGSVVGIISSANVEEWHTLLSMAVVEAPKSQQHFWDGKASQGTKVGLLFGGNSATLVGGVALESVPQEIAIFGK
jgi:hypothetical protein